MPKTLSYAEIIEGGLEVQQYLVVPVLAADPTGAALREGGIWLNATDNVFRYSPDGVGVVTPGEGSLTLEQVRDDLANVILAGNNIDVVVDDALNTITLSVEALTSADLSDFQTAARAAITVSDTATLDLTYAGGQISGAVLDSPLLGGQNSAYHRSRANHTGTQSIATIAAAATARIFGRVTAGAGNGEELTAAQVKTMLALVAADISDFATAADARINAIVTAAFINALTGLDADTLNGSTAAQIQAAVTAAIVDSAPGTLDTLNEIAAAIGDDPNFAATLTALANSRARTFTSGLTGGALTEVVTHNLNTRDVQATVYINSGNYEDEGYIIQRTSVNTITVVSEAGNIPAGRRVVIVAVGT